MSSQFRNDRTDNNRSRFSQSGRREWVPRGSAANTSASSTGTVANPPSSFNLNPKGYVPRGSTANTSASSTATVANAPSSFNLNPNGNTGARRHMGRHSNQQRERGRGNQEEKGSKDLGLPQLVQEIQEKITKGTVECMICYDMVLRSVTQSSI